MTCGPNITELEGPWVEDTQLVLTQTPLSKVHQGDYTIGSPLPDYQIIYTDTGSDTDFKIKYIEYGWRTFTILANEPNYFLQIEKYCELWSGYNGKCIHFKKSEVLTTTIETYHNLSGVASPSSSPSRSPSQEVPEGLSPVPGYNIPPDQMDLSYFCRNMIEDALPWCDPPINYVEEQPAYATFYQVGMQQQFYDMIDRFPWYGTGGWGQASYIAPEKFGFYLLFYDYEWIVVGWYTENGLQYPIYEAQWVIGYAFYIHSIIYGGEEVIYILRDAYIRSDGELG